MTRERLPAWLERLFAAIYAAAGAGVMVLGANTVCDARVKQEEPSRHGLCHAVLDDGYWPVLVLGPAILSILVVRFVPARGLLRRYAWLALAAADVVLVCAGLAYDGPRV